MLARAVATSVSVALIAAAGPAAAEVQAPDAPHRADHDPYPRPTLELAARVAAIGNAARACRGEACDSVAGMIPIAGPIKTAIGSEPDLPLAVSLAVLEATALALVVVGVCDGEAWECGEVRLGLRGPGLTLSGRF